MMKMMTIGSMIEQMQQQVTVAELSDGVVKVRKNHEDVY